MMTDILTQPPVIIIEEDCRGLCRRYPGTGGSCGYSF